MSSLTEKLVKTAVGIVLLPLTAVIDVLCMYSIVSGDSEFSCVRTLRAIADNITDIATGEWEARSRG